MIAITQSKTKETIMKIYHFKKITDAIFEGDDFQWHEVDIDCNQRHIVSIEHEQVYQGQLDCVKVSLSNGDHFHAMPDFKFLSESVGFTVKRVA